MWAPPSRNAEEEIRLLLVVVVLPHVGDLPGGRAREGAHVGAPFAKRRGRARLLLTVVGLPHVGDLPGGRACGRSCGRPPPRSDEEETRRLLVVGLPHVGDLPGGQAPGGAHVGAPLPGATTKRPGS